MIARSVATYTASIALVVLLLIALVSVGAGSGPNLLTNPGCEGGDGVDAPNGWTRVNDGPIECWDPMIDGGPQAAEGSEAFVDAANDGLDASIEQSVQVDGGRTYEISGQVSTFAVGDDYARIEVEYLDSMGSVLPDGQLSHDVHPESSDDYTSFENSSTSPSDAETAVVRIVLVNDDGLGYADAIVDDLKFSQANSPPTANDVDDLEVDVDDALEASVHDDHGNGADNLGNPIGNVSSFGGGDLGGTVTDHDANTTTTLAGGDLTLYDDGTLELATPTENGTYSFDYRLENDAGADDATVTITVVDNSSFAVSIDDANESVAEDETWSIDVGVENVGTNVGTRNLTLEIEDEGGTPVHQDEQEITLAAEANDTLVFEWTPGEGSAGEYEAIVSSDDDSASVSVTVYEFGSIEGTVVDANSNDPEQAAIEGANVTVVFPDATEVETATNGQGEFAFGDLPATGEEYAIAVIADGYHGNATTAIVSDAAPVDVGTITLDGNATIVGTVRDGATGDGLAGANATATTDLGSYEATSDGSGSYTIANVPGDQVYDVTIAVDGYEPNFTAGVSVADEATHELNASLFGNATIEGVVESDAGGQPIEDADVTVVYPNDDAFTVADATGADGSFSIADVPGTGESYDIVVHFAGFEDVTTTELVGDEAVVDVGTISLLGNATVAGTVEDETFGSGVGGVVVNASNGQYEFTTVTDGNGEFVVADVPGELIYDVSVEADGWEPNATTITVADDEDVSGVTVVIAGSDQLEATVYDRLLFENSSDEGLLDGATVTVEHSTLGSVDRTAGDGTVDPVVVPAGETYNLTATMPGYNSHALSNVPNGSLAELFLAGNATIDGTVTDELTGDALENATIVIEYPTGTNATVENATDGTGAYAIDVPGTGEEYAVTASVDGYRNETSPVVAVSGGTVTADFELLPTGEATVSGTATDEVTGSAVANANVTVEIEDATAPGAAVVYEGTTGGDGTYEIVAVIGGYDYNVSIAADGYENASQVESVSETGTTAIDLALAGNASIAGTVVDSPFGVSLEGASVTAVGSQGEYVAETDAGGGYTIDRVPGTGETYAVTVRADGYETNDATVSLGSVGDGTGVDLTLVGNATVVLTATDGVTGEPIGVDANVTVSHATRGEATLVGVSPDGADEYRVAVPGIGDAYDVSIDATGYDSGEEHSTGPLGSGEQTTIAESLLGSAELTGTVTDDTTGDPIANATVTATRGAGTYTAETAADGTYTIQQVAGTGEQYDVTATARAYEDGEQSVAVPEAGETVHLSLEMRDHFFGVENVAVPDEVEGDAEFEIAATIANLGSANWTDSVEFLIDGTVVGSESVQVNAGTDATVAIDHQIGDTGTYAVQVRTANESTNTTVEVVAKPPSSPSVPSRPRSNPDSSEDLDEGVVYEEAGTIERDDTGRHGVTFSEASGVDWVIFDETVEGTVTVATLADEADESDGPTRAPGLGVATYRIDVPDGAENRSATIRVRVTNERLAELGVEPEDLRISRMIADDWDVYETAVVLEAEWGVVLEARTPGFSYFAVTAIRPPEAAISTDPVTVLPGDDVTLSAAGSTGRYGEIVAHEWTVDGRTIEGETITVAFDDAGDYRIELTVTDAHGMVGTRTTTLTVGEEGPDEGERTAETKTTTVDEPPAETTSDGQAGFGVLAAGIALLLVGLLARRR